MNKEQLTLLYQDLDKDVKYIKKAIEKDDELNNDKFEDLNKKCELLKKYVATDFKLTRLYTKAMSFLEWFNFDKLYSDKLRKEAKQKKYKELSEYQNFHNYNEYALSFYDENKNNTISINTQGTIGDTVYFKSNNNWNHSLSYNDDSIKSININRQEIKLNREEPKEKYKWEDTVAYVVSRPFEFNEGVIIAVYNYLKSIVDKDNEIEKYKNGGIY